MGTMRKSVVRSVDGAVAKAIDKVTETDAAIDIVGRDNERTRKMKDGVQKQVDTAKRTALSYAATRLASDIMRNAGSEYDVPEFL